MFCGEIRHMFSVGWVFKLCGLNDNSKGKLMDRRVN